MITVIWSAPADQDLSRLSRNVADRVTEAIARFALTGQGDVRALRGRPGELRLRVGDWRIIFTYERDQVLIRRIRPRGQAYRD